MNQQFGDREPSCGIVCGCDANARPTPGTTPGRWWGSLFSCCRSVRRPGWEDGPGQGLGRGQVGSRLAGNRAGKWGRRPGKGGGGAHKGRAQRHIDQRKYHIGFKEILTTQNLKRYGVSHLGRGNAEAVLRCVALPFSSRAVTVVERSHHSQLVGVE